MEKILLVFLIVCTTRCLAETEHVTTSVDRTTAVSVVTTAVPIYTTAVPVATSTASAGCDGDPNAERRDCGNPCPRTCENKDAGPIACPFTCVQNGCDCKLGYVKEYINGSCVLPEVCPPPEDCDGDPNAERSECGNPCPRTCANKDAGPIACPFICIQNGCDWKPGYVKENIDGSCILSETCPPVESCDGDPNAERRDCGNPCPRTCENKDAGPIPCPYICIPNGCDCKPGYVKEYVNGSCILSDDCPDYGCNGDPNAVRKECADPCPRTCANKNAGPIICPPYCIENGCECKPGYLLNHIDGKCILPRKCPRHHCGPNEVYRDCKNPCPQTCDMVISNAPQPLCLPKYPCPGGCNCLAGYVKNKFGACVNPAECPCPDPNAEVVECPNPCPRTCDNLTTYNKTPCLKMCLLMGCACKKGFVLNKQHKCIKPNKCRK
nr:zonadhesin-like protein 16 [Limnephilus flavicornis]